MQVSGQLYVQAALPHGNRHQYPLDRRLGGSQSRSWRCGEEKSLAPCRDSISGHPARRCSGWAIPTPDQWSGRCKFSPTVWRRVGERKCSSANSQLSHSMKIMVCIMLRACYHPYPRAGSWQGPQAVLQKYAASWHLSVIISSVL
jgi:hypothetical protein